MSDRRAESPRLERAGWVALVCLIALALPALSLLTSQASFPEMTPRAPVIAAEGRRLVLVVVDGLRYDFATDPARAPNFARNMRQHSSAEVWAGSITMTSAAVLSFGTGTRGSFTQVVLNVEARRTNANHLFENARKSGLRTGLIGDPVWPQAYGPFDFQRVSPGDLALDVDDSPELFAVAHDLLRKRAMPELMIVHFFATDHLQHSFGVFSKQFGDFFLRFDDNLQKFLDALPKDTTVVALSDHGALANGNHGVDSDLERKSPMFAYGPGVRPGQKLVLDQVDIAPTLAALLGIPSPAHGIGMPVTELLDAEPARLAELACGEAERVAELGQKTAGTDFGTADADRAACRSSQGPPAERISAAERVARHWDGAIDKAGTRRGLRGFSASLSILVVFGALLPILLGRRTVAAIYGAAAVALAACACVALTSIVDHSLPPWNDSRAAVMWAGSLLLGLVLLAPRRSEWLYRRAPFIALALVPGYLFVSFPTNTQLHSGIVATLVWLAALVAALRAGVPRRILAITAAAGAIGVAAALRISTVREDAFSALSGWLGVGAGMALVTIWLITAATVASPRPESRALELGLGLPLALLSVLPHRWVPAPIGLGLLALLPVLAIATAWRGRGLLARALLFGAYGLVSRPLELVAVLGATLLAESVAALLCHAHRAAPDRTPIGWTIVLATTALFSFGYVARLGVQGGLDFVTMDWGAGAFASTEVPALRITLALVVKYGAALALVGFALLSGLPTAIGRSALRLLTAGLVVRFATMAAILFAPWVSFWSRYRMLGELGPVLVTGLLAAAALIALERQRVLAPERELVASPSRS